MSAPELDPNHLQIGPDVRLDWGMRGLEALLAGGVRTVVIVDVLSWSTAVDVASGRGACIYPSAGDAASVAALAARVGADIAGRRGEAGRPTLSPLSLRSLARGSKLVLPSPNGSTLAEMAATAGVDVFAGCLRNASAIAAAITAFPVGIVAAGERWPDGSLRPALEDGWGAGAIAVALGGPDGAAQRPDWAEVMFGTVAAGGMGDRAPIRGVTGPPPVDADPIAAPRTLSAEAAAAARAVPLGADLPALMADVASGRELVDRGYALDVEVAAALDVSKAVPRMLDGAFRT